MSYVHNATVFSSFVRSLIDADKISISPLNDCLCCHCCVFRLTLSLALEYYPRWLTSLLLYVLDRVDAHCGDSELLFTPFRTEDA